MTERIARVTQVVHQEVGRIVSRLPDLPQGAVVTVTRAELSGNLQQAKVYISVIPENAAREAFSVLKRNVAKVQAQLNERLAMRPVPKVIFMPDEGAQKGQRVTEILNRLRKG